MFTRWAIDLLEEKGEVGGGECCAYSAPRVGKVSGYWMDPDMGRLVVFISRYSGVINYSRIPASEIVALLNGALTIHFRNVEWAGTAASRSRLKVSLSGR